MTQSSSKPVGRPRIENPRTTFSVRLSPEHLRKLDTLAESTGTTRTALIQIAVGRLLKEGL
jgi:predicted DNA-binding protein